MQKLDFCVAIMSLQLDELFVLSWLNTDWPALIDIQLTKSKDETYIYLYTSLSGVLVVLYR